MNGSRLKGEPWGAQDASLSPWTIYFIFFYFNALKFFRISYPSPPLKIMGSHLNFAHLCKMMNEKCKGGSKLWDQGQHEQKGLFTPPRLCLTTCCGNFGRGDIVINIFIPCLLCREIFNGFKIENVRNYHDRLWTSQTGCGGLKPHSRTRRDFSCTVWCNKKGTVFADMSSWTSLS